MIVVRFDSQGGGHFTFRLQAGAFAQRLTENRAANADLDLTEQRRRPAERSTVNENGPVAAGRRAVVIAGRRFGVLFQPATHARRLPRACPAALPRGSPDHASTTAQHLPARRDSGRRLQRQGAGHAVHQRSSPRIR